MYGRRLQILLDEERYQRVNRAARQRKTTVAAVIREAIDRGLPASNRRRQAAADAISPLGTPPRGDVAGTDVGVEVFRGLSDHRSRHGRRVRVEELDQLL